MLKLKIAWIWILLWLLTLFSFSKGYYKHPSSIRITTRLYSFDHKDSNAGVTTKSAYIKSLNQIAQRLIPLLPLLQVSSAYARKVIMISDDNDAIVIPLDKIDSLYIMNYTINESTYRAIVDTGSPFILAPSICSKQWGCEQEKGLYVNSDLDSTIEVFGGQVYN